MALRYQIELRPAALKSLRKVHPEDRKLLQGAIALLGQNPWPSGAKKLRGRDAMRVRVGNYRIIYFVKNKTLLVVIVNVGHRKDIYN